MKTAIRFFMAALLLGFCSLGNCQNVNVRINNQDATNTDNCPYRINGICSTEDIGGVDVRFEERGGGVRDDGTYWLSKQYIVFKNYNSFPVTVLYKIQYDNSHSRHYGEEQIGNMVIGAGESREEVVMGGRWNVTGLIVRKIGK